MRWFPSKLPWWSPRYAALAGQVSVCQMWYFESQEIARVFKVPGKVKLDLAKTVQSKVSQHLETVLSEVLGIGCEWGRFCKEAFRKHPFYTFRRPDLGTNGSWNQWGLFDVQMYGHWELTILPVCGSYSHIRLVARGLPASCETLSSMGPGWVFELTSTEGWRRRIDVPGLCILARVASKIKWPATRKHSCETSLGHP